MKKKVCNINKEFHIECEKKVKYEERRSCSIDLFKPRIFKATNSNILRLKPLNDIQCDDAAFSRETLAQKRCTKKRHPLVRTLVA